MITEEMIKAIEVLERAVTEAESVNRFLRFDLVSDSGANCNRLTLKRRLFLQVFEHIDGPTCKS